MAVVKKKLASLPRTRRILLLQMLIVPALAYLTDLIAGVHLAARLRLPLQLVVVVVLYWWMRGQSVRYQILSAGIAAERAALQLLIRLPDTVTIFSDITLKAGRETAQIDHLLVTPAGIFVLEAKSWKGGLQGDGYQHSWTLLKSGRRGGHYEKSVPNPFGQLDRQVRVVRRLAEQLGKDVATWGLLFLPNQEGQVDVRNQRHQVVVGEQVLKAVRAQPARLSRRDMDSLVGLVNSQF